VDPTKVETQRMLDNAAEVQRVIDAQPNGKELARELGPFKSCDTPTFVQDETPAGEFQVNITSDKADPEENRRRIGLVNEALAEKRALETAATHRRAAEEDRIVVRDERTGDVREVPAAMEDAIARKKWARPGSRKRTYFFFGRAG
jgi:hypothetical protein